MYAGMVLTSLIASWFPGPRLQKYEDVLAACEKELPRNKHCMVIGIPAP